MDELEQLRREIEALRAHHQSFEASNQSLTKNIESLAITNESLVQDAKSLAASNEEFAKTNSDLRKALSKKQDELDALIRRIFGRQSERFEDDDQLTFEFASQAEIDDARDGIQQAIEENKRASRKNKLPKRRRAEERFPNSVPRREVVIDLDDAEKEGLERIGEDVVESPSTRGSEFTCFARCSRSTSTKRIRKQAFCRPRGHRH